MSFSFDASTCLRGVTALAAIGTLMSSLDLLYNRRMLSDQGMWALNVSKIRIEAFRRIGLFRDPLFNGVMVVRVLAALTILAAVLLPVPALPWASLAAVVLFITQLLQNVRMPPDGSGNMETLLWGGLLFAWLLPHDEVVRAAALWFVALQSCLAYAFNGWVKVKHDRWRNGDVVWRLVRHPLFGSSLLAGATEKLPVAGRSVIAGTAFIELIFPLVLVVGFPWAWLFIAWGVLFHTGNAVFMKLHHFWCPFVATYPAILFCVAQVQSL